MEKRSYPTLDTSKRLYGPYSEKDKFREGMVLIIKEIGFNTDTQEMEYELTECKTYDDL